MEHIDLFTSILKEDGFPMPQESFSLFSKYREVIIDWNQRMNLISRRDEGRIITRHFLQSIGLLKVVDFGQDISVLDLGSGAGFPGIPLKLARPDLRVILVESIRKKVLFLQHVIRVLELKGIEVVLGRIEEVGKTLDPVDIIVSRGVSDLKRLLLWTKDCLKPKLGKLVVFKGSDIEKELMILRMNALELGVSNWWMIGYNPFPQAFRLRQSYVVVALKR